MICKHRLDCHLLTDHRLAMWGTNTMTDPYIFQEHTRESGTLGRDHGLGDSQMWKLNEDEDGLFTIVRVTSRFGNWNFVNAMLYES